MIATLTFMWLPPAPSENENGEAGGYVSVGGARGVYNNDDE